MQQRRSRETKSKRETSGTRVHVKWGAKVFSSHYKAYFGKTFSLFYYIKQVDAPDPNVVSDKIYCIQ